MQNLVYNVKYSVVQINFLLLTITLYSSVVTTQNSPFHDVRTELECMF